MAIEKSFLSVKSVLSNRYFYLFGGFLVGFLGGMLLLGTDRGVPTDVYVCTYGVTAPRGLLGTYCYANSTVNPCYFAENTTYIGRFNVDKEQVTKNFSSS